MDSTSRRAYARDVAWVLSLVATAAAVVVITTLVAGTSVPEFGAGRIVAGVVILAPLAALLVLAGRGRRRRATLVRTTAEREAAEARARMLFDASPTPTWVFEDGTLRFLEVNDAALRRYGYARDEFLRLSLRDIRAPDEWKAMEAALQDRPDEDTHSRRSKHRRKDGSTFLVEVRSHPMTYEGRPARLALIEDITAELEVEEALRQNEARFRAMADGSPAGVALIGPGGELQYVNEAALHMMGRSLDQVMTDGWLPAVHEEDRERIWSDWRAAVSAQRAFEGAGRFVKPEGQVVWWRVRTSPIVSGDRVGGYVVVLIDDTGQREGAEALRESEERLRQLAENIPAVVYLLDPYKREMLFVSPAYERIWGRTSASLYADPRSFLEAVHPQDRVRVEALYRERLTRLDMEYRITRPDGQEVWIEDLQFPIRRADGRIYLIGGLAFDATHRHRLEEQLVQSQKMESLGRLAGGVAHDFNNLLTVILSYADLLKEENEDRPEVVAGLTEIEAAGHRAASLTRQLLTFARRQVLDPHVVDLSDLARGMDRMLRHVIGEDVNVEFLPAPGPVRIRADAHQLEQVIMNLAVNARDAMPEGGVLHIETATAHGPIAGTDVPAGDYVTLSIADSGVGIPPELRSKVLEPFFTTKPKGQGTGLGLSTSYGIVVQFGGYLHLSSEVGHGTTVTCYFPRVSEPATVEDVEGSPEHAVHGHETVLVVEDEPTVREVARRTLDRHGYEVLTACDGLDGLDVAADFSGTIHLLVTDMVMPHMGGRELADALKRARPDVRVLFTSGYNEDFVAAGGRIEEGIEFLPKPYLPATLSRRVRQVLDAG